MTAAAPFEGLEPGRELVVPTHPRLGKPAAVYTYVSPHGAPLFAACRFPTEDGGKTFSQGHPTANGAGWAWNLQDVERVLYHADELAAHLEAGSLDPIYVVEGEKAADYLRAHLAEKGLGGVVTTSPMGAGKWHESYTDFLRGARLVIVVADNDETGWKHAQHVAAELRPHVGRVELKRPAIDEEHAGLDDHLAAGKSLDELLDLEPAEEEPADDELPFALLDTDFVKLDIQAPRPLLGSTGRVILPAGGIAIFGGGPGVGKTTFVVDLVYRLSRGEACYGVEPERPLRILIIEGEGPEAEFQAKLEAKLASLPPDRPAGGAVYVQTWRWGWFSFADEEALARAGEFLEEHEIDLVVGDPLNMLGVEGVGSPEDTRRFVQRLRPLGHLTRRSFLFLHHFALESRRDEIAKLSGAWGPHLDSLLTLKEAPDSKGRELILSFPKLRWWREPDSPQPRRLHKVHDGETFEDLGEEEPREKVPDDELVRRLTKYLEEHRDDPKARGKRRTVAGVDGNNERLSELLDERDEFVNEGTGAAHVWALEAWKSADPGESVPSPLGGTAENELEWR